MKRIKKYLKKRTTTINLILERPRQSFTPLVFHKLRIQIKKLNALFEMINFLTHEFNRAKTFRPFKQVFVQAGMLRELQLEESMLKKMLTNNRINDFRSILIKQKGNLKDDFFVIVNTLFPSQIKNSYRKITPLLDEVNVKNVNAYLKKKRNKINKYFNQSPLPSNQIHTLRKLLKTYYYNLKSLGIITNNTIHMDKLLHLMGSWHDCEVIISHLQEIIQKKEMVEKEINRLKKTKLKFIKDKKLLFTKIQKALRSTPIFETHSIRPLKQLPPKALRQTIPH